MRRRIPADPADPADHGAAAVEFALVVPLLLILVFGIIDYGLYFSDSLTVRQGTREGARQGVVNACATMTCLADLTKDRIEPVAGGDEYVRILVPDGWARGNDLVVCATVVVDGVTGLSPMPDGGTTHARVVMRIEQDSPPFPAGQYTADGSPPGGWGFCT